MGFWAPLSDPLDISPAQSEEAERFARDNATQQER